MCINADPNTIYYIEMYTGFLHIFNDIQTSHELLTLSRESHIQGQYYYKKGRRSKTCLNQNFLKKCPKMPTVTRKNPRSIWWAHLYQYSSLGKRCMGALLPFITCTMALFPTTTRLSVVHPMANLPKNCIDNRS